MTNQQPMIVGVIGGGTMGVGIAQVAAMAGLDVILIEQSEELASRAVERVVGNLRKLIDKGKLAAENADAAAARLRGATDYRVLAGVDVVIEAVFEDLEVKRDVARRCADVLRQDAIYTTNTSSISITRIAEAFGDPERVAGMHFFNPVPALPLVEVVRGHGTNQETIDQVMALAGRLGKTAVEVNDHPGFVVNRILLPMINEAVLCLQDGVASPEAIDQAMKLGANHPMGPLALADLIGLDVCLAILEVLERDLGSEKYRPATLLRDHVAAGRLGRKSGEGFYAYER